MKFLYRFFLLVFLFLGEFKFTQAQEALDNLKGDSAVFFVEYASYNGYINDSTYLNMHRSFLFLGKKAAVCIYQKKTAKEFLDNLGEKIDNSGKGSLRHDMVESFKQQFDVEKMVSLIYARYYNSPLFFQHKELDKKDLWIVDTAIYNWKLINEFKYIHDYKCQRADRLSLDGDLITAWFTEEIPISAGPLYLSGLPGLILETSNSKQKHLTKAIVISSTDIPEQNFRKWLTGPIVSRDEYREMYEGDSKKIQQMMRMAEIQKN